MARWSKNGCCGHETAMRACLSGGSRGSAGPNRAREGEDLAGWQVCEEGDSLVARGAGMRRGPLQRVPLCGLWGGIDDRRFRPWALRAVPCKRLPEFRELCFRWAIGSVHLSTARSAMMATSARSVTRAFKAPAKANRAVAEAAGPARLRRLRPGAVPTRAVSRAELVVQTRAVGSAVWVARTRAAARPDRAIAGRADA